MNKVLLSIGLIGYTLVLIGCQSQVVDTLTITHYSLTNESIRLVEGDPSEQPISISVSYRVTEENDEVTRVYLANGQPVDGELQLDQQVTEPTEVVISVNFVGDQVSRRVATILSPAAEIEFFVIYRAPHYAPIWEVLLKDEVNRSLYENQRFTLKGDLSHLQNLNPKLVKVSLHAGPSLVDGSGKTIWFGPLLVVDKEFSVEGDLEKPTLFTLNISYGSGFRVEAVRLQVILEPGVNYRVVPWGNQGKFAVRADRDCLHSKLVSNWQFEPEIVELVNSWGDSVLDAYWGMDREAEEEYKKEQVRDYQVAEQCDDAKLTDVVKSRFIERYEYSHVHTADLIVTSWSESLRQILRDTQDPEIARMIFDLSWRQLRDDDLIGTAETVDRIEILEEIALIMDEEFVDQFITPHIESLMEEESYRMKHSALRPGQTAPKFKLTTIAGDEVSLSEVVSENELVWLGFWASWCSWCTSSFPYFKQVYEQNKDRGFEIITVSLDETFEEWETASKAMELPWIDLGVADGSEMQNNSSLEVDAYQVRLKSISSHVYGQHQRVYGYSPFDSRFLIDEDGCILNKRFSDYELEELLNSLSADLL